jgi:rod shape determining protein RodA
MKLAEFTRFGTTDNRHAERKTLAVRLHMDTPLLFGLGALAVTSLIILYSSSGQNLDMLLRQMARVLLGFGVMFALAQFSPPQLQRWSPWLYLLGLVLLIAV